MMAHNSQDSSNPSANPVVTPTEYLNAVYHIWDDGDKTPLENNTLWFMGEKMEQVDLPDFSHTSAEFGMVMSFALEDTRASLEEGLPDATIAMAAEELSSLTKPEVLSDGTFGATAFYMEIKSAYLTNPALPCISMRDYIKMFRTAQTFNFSLGAMRSIEHKVTSDISAFEQEYEANQGNPDEIEGQ